MKQLRLVYGTDVTLLISFYDVIVHGKGGNHFYKAFLRINPLYLYKDDPLSIVMIEFSQHASIPHHLFM
jgi:hypothetical protein